MRKLGIATLVSNMLILVGAGHGVGPIILIEFLLISHLGSITETFSSIPPHEKPVFISAIILLIGQPLFIFSLFEKNRILKIAALCILLVGFICLIHKIFSGDNSATFSLLFGAPFLILSVIYFAKLMLPVSSSE